MVSREVAARRLLRHPARRVESIYMMIGEFVTSEGVYCLLELSMLCVYSVMLCILFVGIRTLFDRVTRGCGG